MIWWNSQHLKIVDRLLWTDVACCFMTFASAGLSGKPARFLFEPFFLANTRKFYLHEPLPPLSCLIIAYLRNCEISHFKRIKQRKPTFKLSGKPALLCFLNFSTSLPNTSLCLFSTVNFNFHFWAITEYIFGLCF